MRTEQQVLDQILTFAHEHDCIRAVVMNGSRANPNAPKDLFCDYDVVYYVTSPRHFLEDQCWISYFGDLIILQQNDFSAQGLESFIFLMLFSDGVRIDLSFAPLESLATLNEDTLTLVLLDKDGCLPPLPPASDCGYFTQRPTRKVFDETVNEVFWCSNNIAKGIWRGELPYAKYMFDNLVRPCILQMLEWFAAMQYGWAINTGAYGKWLKRFLPPEIWDAYQATYAGADDEDNWEALFTACLLVRKIGTELAVHLGYDYPIKDDLKVVAYLKRVRALPRSARNFDSSLTA